MRAQQRRGPRLLGVPFSKRLTIWSLEPVCQFLVHRPERSQRLAACQLAWLVSFSFLLWQMPALRVGELLDKPISRVLNLRDDQAGFATPPRSGARNFHTNLLRKSFAVVAASSVRLCQPHCYCPSLLTILDRRIIWFCGFPRLEPRIGEPKSYLCRLAARARITMATEFIASRRIIRNRMALAALAFTAWLGLRDQL